MKTGVLIGPMRYFMVIGVFALLATNYVASAGQTSVSKDAPSLWVGAYEATPLKNWASIPEPAKSQIIAHLKNRLGDAFYSKLSLVGGQIFDLKALYQMEPQFKDSKVEIPAYRLYLRFSFPESGIEFYDAHIDCRTDGSVIREIDLPEIAKHADRAHFISASRASQIAEQNGFDLTEAKVELEYRSDLDVCVFKFTQKMRQDGPNLSFKCIDIDSHSGKIIKAYNEEGIQ